MSAQREGPVVVVGGGAIGTSIAYFLREASRPVTLVEKDTLGSGTTAASIAQFIRHQEDPTREACRRRRRAWEWYGPRVEAGDLSFARVGTLHLAASESERAGVERLADSHTAHGLATEVLGSRDLAAFGLDPDRFAGGFLLPDDGYLDPAELVEYWAGAARDAGVSVETGLEVTGVHTAGGEVTGVETTDGTIPAGTVVNAAGPWAPVLDGMVGVSVPLCHTRGPVAVFGIDGDVSLPLTFFENGIYLRSHGEGILAGRFATDYRPGQRFDPDGTFEVEAAFRREAAGTVDRSVSGIAGYDLREEWVGLRTVTPDGYPVVGETSVDGYLLAVGMSGYGITLAPAVGNGVATWLTSGTKPSPIAGLGPDRFG